MGYQRQQSRTDASAGVRAGGASGGTTLLSDLTTYGCGLSALATERADAAAFARDIATAAAGCDAGFCLVFFSQSLLGAAELAAAMAACAPGLRYAGCSTAGEITPAGIGEGQALAILFPRASFAIDSIMIRDLSRIGVEAVAARTGAFKRDFIQNTGSASDNAFALCFIDGLSFAEEMVTSAMHWGLEELPLLGGSAGDDLQFKATHLVRDGEVASDCAILLLVATDLPFQIFKTENFVPTDEKLVVTASDPDRRTVHEFNAVPAAEEFAAAVGIAPQDLSPLSFASHPVVVRVGGEYYCRSIQKVNADGSLSFFCAIDDGVVLSVAKATGMVESTRDALSQIGEKVGGIDVVIGFDCVLRRLDARNRQISREISELYRDNRVIGFGTYGEQYRAMHLNQTLTGIAFGHRQAAE